MLSLAFAGAVPTETGKIALSFTHAIHVVSSWGVLFWSCGPCLSDMGRFEIFMGRLPPHMGRFAASPGGAASPLPARVRCPGAGPGWLVNNHGGDSRYVTLVMSVHGFRLPEDAKERKALYGRQEAKCRRLYGRSKARAYPVAGLTVSREAVHFFSVILGINRAVNWLASRPYVDKRHITYSGASQGGGSGIQVEEEAAGHMGVERSDEGLPVPSGSVGKEVHADEGRILRDGRGQRPVGVSRWRVEGRKGRQIPVCRRCPYGSG